MKTCSNCGTQCEDEQKFCFQCGAKFEEEKSGNKLLWLIFSVLIIAISFFCFELFGNKKDDPYLAAVKVGDKYGFINSTGEMVIEPKFYGVREGFKDGYVSVASRNNSKDWGIIDKTGAYVVKPQYVNLFRTSAKNIYEAQSREYSDDNYFWLFNKYIDINGKELFNGQLFCSNSKYHLPSISILADNLMEWYDNANKANENIYDIKTFDEKVLLKNLNLNKTVIGDFKEESYAICGEIGLNSITIYLVDKHLNKVKILGDFYYGREMDIQDKSFRHQLFADCLELVHGGKYGCNRIISIAEFDKKFYLDRYKYNCHTRRIDDENGNELLEIRANRISAFKNGYAVYANDEIGESGLIDLNGNIALKYKDQDGQVYGHVGKNGLVPFKKNGKCGFIDVKGNEIIPCKYSRVGSFGE